MCLSSIIPLVEALLFIRLHEHVASEFRDQRLLRKVII